MNVNYNVDLDPRLFGRDASGKGKSSAAPSGATAPQQQPASKQQAEKPKTKDAPEYRITEVAIVVPSDGLKKDQPFDIKGKVQPLAGTLTKKKVRIELITRYKDAEDKFASVEADIGSDNTFTGSCKQLFYHDGYQRDKEKPADAKFTLEAKASGAGAEKEVVSKTVDLPMATSTIVLKKGKYDDAWAKGHEATHPKSGKDFVPDTKVKKLQENLVAFRFFKNEQVSGMFDEATEAAVKNFQELAKKPERKKASDVKLEKTEKITFKGEANGVVEEKTETEIALWLQNSWVKPDPEYRKDDVDDNGVKNKHGERGSDKHHPGTGITDMQKLLASAGAYSGKNDGWFSKATYDAVVEFQEYAEKGDCIDAKGAKKPLEEKDWLKGHRAGVGDGPTIDMLKLITGKGLKIANVLTFPGTKFKYRKAKTTVQECVATLPSNLRPDFKKDIEAVIQGMHDLGIAFGTNTPTSGYRTFAQQLTISASKTSAGPGESFHSYGVAVDLGVIEWVDEDGKSYKKDFWLLTMDNIAKYKGFSNKIWTKRDEIGGNNLHVLSKERIHMQSMPSGARGALALVKALNEACSQLGDTTWSYRNIKNVGYECSLGSATKFTNVGTSEQMLHGTSPNCTKEQKEKIKAHMKKAESLALTITL
jgi:peptidoglycan hydrolase-like protein with peptidoglycan-binding domain